LLIFKDTEFQNPAGVLSVNLFFISFAGYIYLCE
jgi:hypothetical protein